MVGAYLHGSAKLSYVSADPLEAATFRTNLQRNTRWKLHARGELETSVEGVLLLLSSGAAELAGGSPWTAGEPPAEARTAFARHLDRFAMDLGPRYPTLLAQALVDPPSRPLAANETVSLTFQAPPGVVFLTKEAFTPLQDELSRTFSEDVNARLAHEVAHTWWGHVAMWPSPEDQWIAESAAEYFSAFAIGNLWKKVKFAEALDKWRAISRFVKDRGTVLLASQLSGELAGEDRVGLLYGKGPLVLHALRQELGDQVFFTIMKSFITNFTFKPAETRQLVRVTSFAAKKDYGPFFERYITGADWPGK